MCPSLFYAHLKMLSCTENLQNSKYLLGHFYTFYLQLRSTEELTRLLTPIIEDCVKRNMEALLTRLRPNLLLDFNSNQVDQQNINDSPSDYTRTELSLAQPESGDQRGPIRGQEELSEELGRTVASLGLDQNDRARVWQQLGSGISLQDFYIGKYIYFIIIQIFK